MKRKQRWLGAALAAAALLAVAMLLGRVPPGSPRAAASLPTEDSSAGPRQPAPPPAAAPVARSLPPKAPPTAPAPPLPPDTPAGATVDLGALRRKLPRNLYWQLGVPTDDPRLLEERETDARRWDELFGRIQSGIAGEEEIAAYFDHRRSLSEDYRALALQILQDQGDDLSERDRGLYALSVRMHTDRLEELPRKLAEALERKRQQDAARAVWEAARP